MTTENHSHRWTLSDGAAVSEGVCACGAVRVFSGGFRPEAGAGLTERGRRRRVEAAEHAAEGGELDTAGTRIAMVGGVERDVV